MKGCVRGLVCGVGLCLVLWWCGESAIAQQVNVAIPPDDSADTRRADTVEESKLPFYLRDKDGKLVLMPGWTFEEFEHLYQQTQGLALAERSPQWVIESLVATGTARASHAELKITLSVLLGSDEAVHIPLRFDEAVLRAPVEYDGAGQPLVYFDAHSGGYAAVLQGKSRQQVHLTLNALVPLAAAGGQNRLALTLPQATQSSMTLEVPLPDAAAELSEGSVLTARTPTDHGTTQLEIQGPRGAFQLTWHKPTEATQPRPVFEATGEISASLDARAVNTKATLTIHSYGKTFDHVRVRLAPDAELLPVSEAGYRVVALPSESRPSGGDAPGEQVVEVHFAQAKLDQVLVLETRQPLDTSGAAEWSSLGGFEVVEAARQWGQITVRVVDDLYVFWGPQRGVEQVERSPLATWDKEVAGTFQYHSQPFLLSVRVAPRRTRLSVEPQYVFSVNADHVSLQATLKYAARGAKVSSLEVRMPGWTIDDAGPYDKLVAMGGMAVDQTGLVSVALSEPTTGDFTLTLSAHQNIKQPDADLTLSLPQPQADSVGPAAVAVLAADNIELVADPEQTVGLTRQLVVPPMTLPERYQQPLFYRAETAAAAFAASVHRHARSVSVQLTSEVDFTPERSQVRQTFAYTIAYGRVPEVDLDVPRAIAAGTSLEVSLDGQPLAVTDPPEATAGGISTGRLRKRVVLPEPHIGPLKLVVRYAIELERLRPETEVVATVPLVMPHDGELLGNSVVVTAPGGITVDRRAGPWNVVAAESPVGERGEVLRLVSAEKADQVALSVRLENRDAAGATTADRVWIQTWLLSNRRQDHAVFCLTSDRKSVDLFVPDGVELSQVILTLDGQPVEVVKKPEGGLTVPLAGDAGGRTQRLELWYSIRRAHRAPGQTIVELPRLGRDVWVRRTYWQLMLPANEHLLAGPEGMVPEYRWQWTGVLWRRAALLEQQDLEAWAGVKPTDPTELDVNCYLFGSLGAAGQCAFRTASRSIIVLMASGLALVLGLAWIYLPATHHPVSLLAASLVLLTVALLYPGPTLLALEAALFGVALALLAGLLHRSLVRRRGLAPGEPPSSVYDWNTTRSLQPAAHSASSHDRQLPATAPSEAVSIAPPDSG